MHTIKFCFTTIAVLMHKASTFVVPRGKGNKPSRITQFKSIILLPKLYRLFARIALFDTMRQCCFID